MIESVREPVTVRLMTWSVLRGRAFRSDFAPMRMNGLKLVVDMLTGRLGPEAPRARVEQAVMIAMSAIFGLALAGPWLHEALGRGPAASFDLRDMRSEIGAMLVGYLEPR